MPSVRRVGSCSITGSPTSSTVVVRIISSRPMRHAADHLATARLDCQLDRHLQQVVGQDFSPLVLFSVVLPVLQKDMMAVASVKSQINSTAKLQSIFFFFCVINLMIL